MSVERVLRDTLHAHADEAGALPRTHGLAAVARWRARELRNQRLVAGAASLLLVVAAALTVPHLSWTSGEASQVLQPASQVLPDFPYTPGWLPDGVAAPHVLMSALGPGDPELYVDHEAEGGDPLDVVMQLRILSPEEYADGSGGELVAVRGTEGRLHSNGRWVQVTWTDGSGRHLNAGASESEVGEEALRRYVEQLVERPLAVTPPVTLSAVPAGAEVSVVAPYFMQLSLPDGGALTFTLHDPAFVDGLRADLRTSPSYQLPPPATVEVAGRPAQLAQVGRDELALSIGFEADLMLTIAPWRYGRAELLTFAEGIELTPYARPAAATVPGMAGQPGSGG